MTHLIDRPVFIIRIFYRKCEEFRAEKAFNCCLSTRRRIGSMKIIEGFAYVLGVI